MAAFNMDRYFQEDFVNDLEGGTDVIPTIETRRVDGFGVDFHIPFGIIYLDEEPIAECKNLTAGIYVDKHTLSRNGRGTMTIHKARSSVVRSVTSRAYMIRRFNIVGAPNKFGIRKIAFKIVDLDDLKAADWEAAVFGDIKNIPFTFEDYDILEKVE